MDIPTLDFSKLLAGDKGYQSLAKDFYAAYSTLGFGRIINHSVPHQLIADMFEQSKAFHELEENIKLKYRYQGQYIRGYLPLNISTLKTSKLAEVKKPNQSESFMIVSEATDADEEVLNKTPFGGKQTWPKELPHFKTVAQQYYKELCKLSHELVIILSLSLGLPRDFLNKFFTHPHVFLRLLCFPPHPLDAPDDLYGSAPHTDYGFFTLLAQDSIGGLQVKLPNNAWLDVVPEKNTFILNTGDMIERWSNGLLKSTPHRAINKSHNKSRYSIPFFYSCHYETIVEPLPTCISPARPAQFTPVSYGENISEKFYKNYILKDNDD